jgi:hypothetical protein
MGRVLTLFEVENTKETRNRGKNVAAGGNGDAAATMAHAVKGGDGEDEEDVDAAAAFPHAVAPVEAPFLYCYGGERSMYCCGGAKEYQGGSDGDEEKDGDTAAPRVYSCGGAEERKEFGGDAAA